MCTVCVKWCIEIKTDCVMWQWEYFTCESLSKSAFAAWMLMLSRLQSWFTQLRATRVNDATFIRTHVSSSHWLRLYFIPFITQHHTVYTVAHAKNLGLNYYIINTFICWLANSIWSAELFKMVETQQRIGLRNEQRAPLLGTVKPSRLLDFLKILPHAVCFTRPIKRELC